MELTAHCNAHDVYTKTCGACRFSRLVEMDRTEVVYPNGQPERVPRDQCRCPVLRVGDFCPVHGG